MPNFNYSGLEFLSYRIYRIKSISHKENYFVSKENSITKPQYILLIIWNTDRSLVTAKQFDRGRYNYKNRPESNILNNQMTTMQMHFKTYCLFVIVVYILNYLNFYVQFLLPITQPQLYYR